MLSRNSYSADYVEQALSAIDRQVALWQELETAAVSGPETVQTAVRDLEPAFFNNLVLALESFFVHRSRTMEKKNGNPMNEVRVLAHSLMTNEGRLAQDASVKLDPATSVLHLTVGDEIALSAADFARLADAFFAAVRTTFVTDHFEETA